MPPLLNEGLGPSRPLGIGDHLEGAPKGRSKPHLRVPEPHSVRVGEADLSLLLLVIDLGEFVLSRRVQKEEEVGEKERKEEIEGERGRKRGRRGRKNLVEFLGILDIVDDGVKGLFT